MAAVESETENKPFVLIARIHVKLGNVDQYLEIVAKVDEEVESSEPGMLFHNFGHPRVCSTGMVPLQNFPRPK